MSSIQIISTPSTTNVGLRIGINVTEEYVPFSLNFSSSAAATAATNTTAHFESSTQLIIQRRANFNFVGGFLMIHVPTKANSVEPSNVTTPASGSTFSPCADKSTVVVPTGTPPTYYCPVTTDATEWQVAGTAALNYFPFGRNYYPEASRYRRWRTYRDMFGLLVGTSVTSLGSGLGGVSLEPTNGVSLFAGVASAHNLRLAAGTGSAGTIYTTSSPLTITTLHAGFAAGIRFDFSVFTQLFKAAGAGAPTVP